MTKIFISQPMNCRSEEEILEERDDIWWDWLDHDHYDGPYDLIDSYRKSDIPEGAGRLWYLGDSIQKMADADIVIFAPGWEKASGCHVEYEVAKRYGIIAYRYKEGNFIRIIFAGGIE